MATLPSQFDLYYSISRGRMGIIRLKEILEKEKIKINGTLPGLAPSVIQATISMDEEIFNMILDAGGDIEITPAKAEKIPMPNFSSYIAAAGKDLGKKIAGNTMRRFLYQIPIVRDITRGMFKTGNTSVNSQVRETMNTRERINQFIEREQNAWKNIAGEYFEDLTPFACAVLRKDSRVTDILLEKYNVNPNPILKGKTLANILREQDRENLAKRLEVAEKQAAIV